jgi:hypothetical protein
VTERQLVRGGVPAFSVLDEMKKIGLVSERAGDRAQTSDVFRMTPARVVTSAIAV